jgi:hypothetical protein
MGNRAPLCERCPVCRAGLGGGALIEQGKPYSKRPMLVAFGRGSVKQTEVQSGRWIPVWMSGAGTNLAVCHRYA